MKATNTSQRLKELMNERGLKQVDILKKSLPYQKEFEIKMSKSTLSQYVTGVQSPDQDRIFLLSKTLGVSEPWLMGYDVPRERIPDEERNDNQKKTYSASTKEIADYIEENPDFAESIR
ncbi:helix-turn-helix domain-containing protein, partial [Listeria booriae]